MMILRGLCKIDRDFVSSKCRHFYAVFEYDGSSYRPQLDWKHKL